MDARNGLEHGRLRLAWALDRFTQRAVDTYLANSVAVVDLLKSRGIASDRVRLVESAIGQGWARPIEVTRDENLVLMVGNQRPEKNHQLGLRAVAALAVPVDLRVFTDDATELRRLWHEGIG